VEEGEVGVGFAVASGGDPAFRFQPGVGAFDGPAVACVRIGGFEPSFLAAPDLAGRGACRDWLAAAAWLADPRFDLTLTQRSVDRVGGITAVGP